MTRQPDRKLWHVTCSAVRWLQARRESESCVRGRARKVSATLRGCGGSCEESSKGLIIDKMNSVPCFLRQISGLTLNGTYGRRRNVCVRALAASPESDDDTFFFFFFLGNDRYQRKPGDVALTFGKVTLEIVRFACARRRRTWSPLTPLGPGTPASPLNPCSSAIKSSAQSWITKEEVLPCFQDVLQRTATHVFPRKTGFARKSVKAGLALTNEQKRFVNLKSLFTHRRLIQ